MTLLKCIRYCSEALPVHILRQVIQAKVAIARPVNRRYEAHAGTAMSFGHINFDARNEAICQSLKDRARAARDHHVLLVSNYALDATRRRHAPDVRSSARSVFEVSTAESSITASLTSLQLRQLQQTEHLDHRRSHGRGVEMQYQLPTYSTVPLAMTSSADFQYTMYP